LPFLEDDNDYKNFDSLWGYATKSFKEYFATDSSIKNIDKIKQLS